jgi:hypothetical protein
VCVFVSVYISRNCRNRCIIIIIIIINEGSVLINDLLDFDILLSKSVRLKRFYAVIRSLMFYVNYGCNLVRLYFIVFCIVYAIVLCDYLSNRPTD